MLGASGSCVLYLSPDLKGYCTIRRAQSQVTMTRGRKSFGGRDGHWSPMKGGAYIRDTIEVYKMTDLEKGDCVLVLWIFLALVLRQ